MTHRFVGYVLAVRASTGAIAICLSATLVAAAEITIDTPKAGALISTGVVRVEGHFIADSSKPRILLRIIGQNYEWKATIRENGTWSCEIPIPLNDCSIVALLDKEKDLVTVTRSPSILAKQATQLLRVQWDADAAHTVLEILQHTLQPDPGANAEDGADVTNTVSEIISKRLRPFDIQLTVDSRAVSHSVLVGGGMRDGRPEYFGWTPLPDCGNASASGESFVYLGAVADSLVRDFPLWAPMSFDDSLEERKTDLAFIIADLTLHEFFHGLGLVACPWTASDQKDLFHNPPAWQLDQGVSEPRWENGARLMDSGAYALPYLYIGAQSRKDRGRAGIPRAPRTFSPFDISYLSTLFPRP